MKIIQYLPDTEAGASQGLRTTIEIFGNNYSAIKITKEKMTRDDYIKIFGECDLNDYLLGIARYIIEIN